jgi:hypothetical protein
MTFVIVLFQGVVIEPKLPSRVTVRIRQVVPITNTWTSRKSAQQGDTVNVWKRRTCRDKQADAVYVGQLTR